MDAEEEDWIRFIVDAKSVMGAVWWTSRQAVQRLSPAVLPRQVSYALQKGNENGAVKSLGKLLAARRGWHGDLRLDSKGTRKQALTWRLLTLDQVLESESGVP
jgi:hypothetical protein